MEASNMDMLNVSLQKMLESQSYTNLGGEPDHESERSENFDRILHKISELKKDVCGSPTFEIRKEGVYKVYEVKKTMSGHRHFELHAAIDHPVNDLDFKPIPIALYQPFGHHKYIEKFEDENDNEGSDLDSVYDDGEIDRPLPKSRPPTPTPSQLFEVRMTQEERAQLVEAGENAKYERIFGGRTYSELMDVWESTKPAIELLSISEEEEEAESDASAHEAEEE